MHLSVDIFTHPINVTTAIFIDAYTLRPISDPDQQQIKPSDYAKQGLPTSAFAEPRLPSKCDHLHHSRLHHYYSPSSTPPSSAIDQDYYTQTLGVCHPIHRSNQLIAFSTTRDRLKTPQTKYKVPDRILPTCPRNLPPTTSKRVEASTRACTSSSTTMYTRWMDLWMSTLVEPRS